MFIHISQNTIDKLHNKTMSEGTTTIDVDAVVRWLLDVQLSHSLRCAFVLLLYYCHGYCTVNNSEVFCINSKDPIIKTRIPCSREVLSLFLRQLVQFGILQQVPEAISRQLYRQFKDRLFYKTPKPLLYRVAISQEEYSELLNFIKDHATIINRDAKKIYNNLLPPIGKSCFSLQARDLLSIPGIILQSNEIAVKCFNENYVSRPDFYLSFCGPKIISEVSGLLDDQVILTYNQTSRKAMLSKLFPENFIAYDIGSSIPNIESALNFSGYIDPGRDFYKEYYDQLRGMILDLPSWSLNIRQELKYAYYLLYYSGSTYVDGGINKRAIAKLWENHKSSTPTLSYLCYLGLAQIVSKTHCIIHKYESMIITDYILLSVIKYITDKMQGQLPRDSICIAEDKLYISQSVQVDLDEINAFVKTINIRELQSFTLPLIKSSNRHVNHRSREVTRLNRFFNNIESIQHVLEEYKNIETKALINDITPVFLYLQTGGVQGSLSPLESLSNLMPYLSGWHSKLVRAIETSVGGTSAKRLTHFLEVELKTIPSNDIRFERYSINEETLDTLRQINSLHHVLFTPQQSLSMLAPDIKATRLKYYTEHHEAYSIMRHFVKYGRLSGYRSNDILERFLGKKDVVIKSKKVVPEERPQISYIHTSDDEEELATDGIDEEDKKTYQIGPKVRHTYAINDFILEFFEVKELQNIYLGMEPKHEKAVEAYNRYLEKITTGAINDNGHNRGCRV